MTPVQLIDTPYRVTAACNVGGLRWIYSRSSGWRTDDQKLSGVASAIATQTRDNERANSIDEAGCGANREPASDTPSGFNAQEGVLLP